jgi:hypothetical protein
MMRAKRLENVHTHKPPEGEQGENFHKTFSFLNFFFFLSGNLFLKKKKKKCVGCGFLMYYSSSTQQNKTRFFYMSAVLLLLLLLPEKIIFVVGIRALLPLLLTHPQKRYCL